MYIKEMTEAYNSVRQEIKNLTREQLMELFKKIKLPYRAFFIQEMSRRQFLLTNVSAYYNRFEYTALKEPLYIGKMQEIMDAAKKYYSNDRIKKPGKRNKVLEINNPQTVYQLTDDGFQVLKELILKGVDDGIIKGIIRKL